MPLHENKSMQGNICTKQQPKLQTNAAWHHVNIPIITKKGGQRRFHRIITGITNKDKQ